MSRASGHQERVCWLPVSSKFLTNHAHVLVSVARTPGARVRDIADSVGITERAALRLVHDLEKDGYLTRHRVGARNFYEVHLGESLLHPLEGNRTIGDLLRPLLRPLGAEGAGLRHPVGERTMNGVDTSAELA